MSIDMIIALWAVAIVFPIALAMSFARRTIKEDPELRENLKDVAKTKGQEALVKGIAWMLKSRK